MALVGFSQGAMMSLYVSLRRAKPVAGVVAYSGRLFAAEALAVEMRSKPEDPARPRRCGSGRRAFVASASADGAASGGLPILFDGPDRRTPALSGFANGFVIPKLPRVWPFRSLLLPQTSVLVSCPRKQRSSPSVFAARMAVRDYLGTKPRVQIGDAELPELADAIALAPRHCGPFSVESSG